MIQRPRAIRLLELILARWRWVLLSVTCLTAPCAWLLANAEFSPSIVESFVDSRQEYLDAMRLEAQYPHNPDSLLWLATDEGDQLFAPETLSAISDAAREIRQLPFVRDVICLPELALPTPRATGMRGTTQRIVLNAQLKRGEVPETLPNALLNGRTLRAVARRNARSIEQLRADVLADGYLSQFVSRDGRAHVMLIELDPLTQLTPGDQVSLVAGLQAIPPRHQLGRRGVYLSGLIPLQAFAFEQIGLVLRTLLPIGGGLIALAVMLVFKRIEVILFTLLLAAISVSWGVALGAVAYGKFSALMAAVPLMVLVISTADVIHLLSSYTAERAAGFEHRQALGKMFSEVGGACVLTSLTTFVGFASLVFVPSNTIRQFGFSAAAGVASALLLSIILIPIFLEWLQFRGKPILASESASRVASSVARNCLAAGIRWHKGVIALFLLLLLGSGLLASKLKLDPDLTRRFTSEHSIPRSTQFFAQQFGGINALELIVRGEPDELLSPENFSAMQRFARQCKSQVGATRITSIADVVRPLLKQLDYTNELGSPESAMHARAAIHLVRQVKPEIVDALITPDLRELRMIVRIQETSYMRMLDVSTAIQKLAHEQFSSQLTLIEKGSAPLVGRAVREIIRGHLQGLFFCFTTVFLLIVVGLRSFKLGCVSVLPNLTPLFFLGGLIGLSYDRVDSDILAVATLGLGLAVDDTIHFLSRYEIEIGLGKSPHEALLSTMNHTGVAIIRTTVILSVGFLPFALSGYWSISMLGTYLVAVLVAALLADLILLPAILWLVYPDRK